jgi:DNA-binding MarR family transcriptional regulator
MTTPDPRREQAASGLEQLAALVRVQAWRAGGGVSLPPTQAAILRMLLADPALRARQIADRLDVSAASLSDSLKAMEAKDWIRRTPDPLDGRAWVIALTRGGRAMARQLGHPSQGMAALLQGLDERDVGALLRITQLLVREAQRQGLATGARTCLGCAHFRPNASDDARHPHFCAFVQQPFGDPELRADCPEHVPAQEAQLATNAERFRPTFPS